MAHLLVARRDGALVVSVDLARRRKVTVGRSGRCELHLDAPSISRRHALLVRHDEVWHVIDTASATGVHVPVTDAEGDEARQIAPLSHETWVRVGPAFLWIEGEMEAPADEALPLAQEPGLEAGEVEPPVLRVHDLMGRPLQLLSLAGRDAVTIGRARSCDLMVHDSALSRFHAVVYLEGDQWCICDAGSSGGTRVEGVGVRRRRLDDHMLIRAGASLLRIDGCHLGSGEVESPEGVLFDTGGDQAEFDALPTSAVTRPPRAGEAAG